jgi:hypothetical protein
MMEAANSSETLVLVCQTKDWHIPEEDNLREEGMLTGNETLHKHKKLHLL